MKNIYILFLLVRLFIGSDLTAQPSASLLIKRVNCDNSMKFNFFDSISLSKNNIELEKSGEGNSTLSIYSNLSNGDYKFFYRSSETGKDSLINIPIKTSNKYLLTICPTSMDVELNIFTSPVDKIKINEFFLVKIITEGCFDSGTDSFMVCRKSNNYEFIRGADTILLTEADLEDIRTFEYLLNGCVIHRCTITEKYIITYNELRQTIVEGTCKWRPYEDLKGKIYSRR